MTSNFRLILTVAGLGIAGMLLAPRASADEWNERTTVTVNAPVEIPGTVLAPGTYTFKLADSLVDRDIVQVFNKNGTRLYATVMGIPDYRLKVPAHTVIQMEERPAGTAEAIRDWFYPGNNYGIEFLYPKTPVVMAQAMPPKPMQPACVTPAPVKTAVAAVAAKQPAVKSATYVAKKSKPVEMAEATTPAVPVPMPAPPAAKPVARPRRTLPKTASDYPLLGLLGFFALAGAGALRLFARQRA